MFPLQLFGVCLCASFSGKIREQGSGLSELQEGAQGIQGRSMCGDHMRRHFDVHVVNIRTDIEFVLFAGEFATPSISKRSNSLTIADPNQPLYGHLSSIDSTGTSVSPQLATNRCVELAWVVLPTFGSMDVMKNVNYIISQWSQWYHACTTHCAWVWNNSLHNTLESNVACKC